MCAELKSRVLIAAGVVVMIGELVLLAARDAAIADCLICKEKEMDERYV